MFCLRSFIFSLIFLTNTSPIYVILFLIATYALQRPCVYCSILLFVLVFSLFDFSGDWFEPRWHPEISSITETLSSFVSGNATVTDALLGTATLAVSAINGTKDAVANTVMEGFKRRVGTGNAAAANASGFEWLRGLLEKRLFRIPCIDVTVRL